MKQYMVDALNKLAELKNNIIEVEQLDDPPEIAFAWGTDPFYVVHRNVALELMHKGHAEESQKMFEDYVNYQYPERLEDAKADLKNVWDGLIPLTRENIQTLYKQHKGVVVSTDIYYPLPYVNYTFINVSEDERSIMLEDEYNTVVSIDWILDGERELNNAYLDVYNTKLNNARYPFLKM